MQLRENVDVMFLKCFFSLHTRWPECIHCECQLSAIIPCSQGWHTSIVLGPPPALREFWVINGQIVWETQAGSCSHVLESIDWAPPLSLHKHPLNLLLRSEAPLGCGTRVCSHRPRLTSPAPHTRPHYAAPPARLYIIARACAATSAAEVQPWQWRFKCGIS